MLIKFLITFFVLFNLNYPIVSLIDISLICLLIFLLISSKSNLSIKKIILQKYKIFLIIILLSIINIISPKLKIEEAHSIFINNNDLNVISKFLPANVLINMKKNFQKFDLDRMIKSHNYTLENYKNLITINKPYAYSSDSFFQKNKFTRQVNKINFSSREDLRIGQLNTLKYNFAHDKNFRRILPYYVLYEIPKISKNSKLCINGSSYYYFSNKNVNSNKIKNLPFIKKQNGQKCLNLNKNFEKLYVIAFSINEKDDLSINLIKNYFLIFLDLIYYIIISIIIIIFSFFILQTKFNITSLVYFLSSISTFLLAIIFDPNMVFGFRYFRGGADGLLHNSFAQDIIQNISEGNYYLALKGGSSIFYFMPGLRYFEAFNKMFFGDTNFAYLLLATLLPFSVFIFFKKYLDNKYAIILFVSFIFVPIFENMGFGYFNYVWQIARNHAETLSITLICLSLVFLIDINQNTKKINNEKILLILTGLSLAIATISRPNFFPTTIILCFYASIIYLINKNYLKIFLILISFSFVFICLIHNVYFGNSIDLFTNANVHFQLNLTKFINSITNIIFFNFQNENAKFLLSQLNLWNPLYNFHRLIIIGIIIYFILFHKQSLFTYSLFICALSQHIVLLLTHPSSRYAYLAWLLTFILFMKIEFDNKFFKSLYYYLKNKKKLIK